MSTQLEDFPNELILNLFVYFDISNLYQSFWGINQRFNNLLRSLNNLSFIIEKDDSILIEIFARQITRLKVNTSQPIDLSQFLHLHSLELCQASSDQLEQIRSNTMPNLMNLIISTRSHISLPLTLIHEIFSNSFHLLRHANINRLDTYQISSQFQSISLYSLIITSTDTNIIPQILLACPNLYHFDITFFGQNGHILPPSSSSYDHVLEKFSLNDPYHKLSVGTIEILLLYIPNVKFLSLQVLYRAPFINLIDCILNRLEHLDRFECEIFECPNDHMVNVDVIQQMNNCFQYLQCDEKDDGSRMFFTE